MFMMKKTYLFCFHFIVDWLHVLQNRSRGSLRHVFPDVYEIGMSQGLFHTSINFGLLLVE